MHLHKGCLPLLPAALLPAALLPAALLLAGCQGMGAHRAADAGAPAAPATFNDSTVQTYDPQTEQYQQPPPFGDRSNH